jgi:CTP:molybdopterin cytidylyltransferase MocA
MGSPKALLPWRGTTLLEYAIQQASAAAIEDIVVVLGPSTRHLEEQLAGVEVAYNPEPETGRSASIRIGCTALPDDPGAVLIQSVDQPITADVLVTLFETVERASSVDGAVPTYEGRRGHPLVFAGHILPELRLVNERSLGLRDVVRQHADALREVPVATESVLWNLNDPVAYAAAVAQL